MFELREKIDDIGSDASGIDDLLTQLHSKSSDISKVISDSWNRDDLSMLTTAAVELKYVVKVT